MRNSTTLPKISISLGAAQIYIRPSTIHAGQLRAIQTPPTHNQNMNHPLHSQSSQCQHSLQMGTSSPKGYTFMDTSNLIDWDHFLSTNQLHRSPLRLLSISFSKRIPDSYIRVSRYSHRFYQTVNFLRLMRPHN